MLRIDFFNEIARILNHPESDSLEIDPTPEEEDAIRHMMDILGRTYHVASCDQVVSTYFQDVLARAIDPSLPEPGTHDDCPCIRSEPHTKFHRCKHGFYSE